MEFEARDNKEYKIEIIINSKIYRNKVESEILGF